MLRFRSWSHTRYKKILVPWDFRFREDPGIHTSAFAAKHVCSKGRRIKIDESVWSSRKTSDKKKNLKDKKALGFAAKFVNSAKPEFQPYLKLMRIDKPIGKLS